MENSVPKKPHLKQENFSFFLVPEHSQHGHLIKYVPKSLQSEVGQGILFHGMFLLLLLLGVGSVCYWQRW